MKSLKHSKKGKVVEVYEEWRKGMSSPEIFVLTKDMEKKILKEATWGDTPFVVWKGK